MGGLFENVLLALAGLKSNKMRALLTMLGIIIGIGSVIAIVTVGDSLTSFVNTSMQNLGATNILVGLQQKTLADASGVVINTGPAPEPEEDDLISDEMIEELYQVYPNDVEAVSLSESVGAGTAKDGRKYANLSISGVNDDYAVANHIDLSSGRFINDRDVQGGKSMCVVSDWLVNALFGGTADPLGKELKVTIGERIHTFAIAGVYAYEPSMFNMSSASEKDTRTDFYIPISVAKELQGADDGYQMITIMASTESDNAVLTGELRDFFNKFYENNPRFSVMAINMQSMVSEMTGMLDNLSVGVAIIAAISLLVGGIGVMNIMLVSVTERTREIGTRKALGARSSSIRTQFIVEAVIICCIGGIIGVITGMSLGALGSSLLGFPANPSVPVILLAVGFSMVIGIFFGYYPANKAAKLDPIEALRYE